MGSINVDTKQMNKIVYTSKLSHHNITVEIDFIRCEAYIDSINIDHKYPTELAMLLKFMCDNLTTSKIETIMQPINPTDWEYLKNIKQFKLVNKKKNFFNISCKTSEFSLAFMEGLGFNA